MKKKVKVLLFVVLLLIIAFIIGVFCIRKYYEGVVAKPNSDSTEKITFTIETGESVEDILDTLVNTKLLDSDYLFIAKYYLRENDISSKLQAGVYDVPMNLSIRELFETLQNAQDQDIWVTIPEGLRKDEIATLLGEEFNNGGNSTFSALEFINLCIGENFIDTLGLSVSVSDLEGFLFPDKYAFKMDSTASDVIEKMIENFKEKVGYSYTYDDIIIASIVEREGYNNEDRGIISGIIQKRLREGWLLQVDATLLYYAKDWSHTITQEDKNSDNPYNTYKVIGLPPTPICNPGLESIHATQNPVSTEYYYYIHDNDKIAHYARNLAEHNTNVSKYLY